MSENTNTPPSAQLLKTLTSQTKTLIKSGLAFSSDDSQFQLQIAPPSLIERLDQVGDKLLGSVAKVLSSRGRAFDASRLKDILRGDGMAKWDEVKDLLDGMFERIDTELEQVNPKRLKTLKSVPGTNNGALQHRSLFVNVDKDTNQLTSATGDNVVKVYHGFNVLRPQENFDIKPDNSQNSPFVSLVYQLGVKPNALKPLTQTQLDTYKGKNVADLDYETAFNLPHPYHFELNHIDYPEELFTSAEPIPAKGFNNVPLKMVSNEQDLNELMEELEGVTIIAIDLEHHDFRSYHGFVCLMQISTRNKDYLIDTLTLRSKLFSLNKYFTDPKIIKVLHGADHDIIWLQRDFGLYIVNMFDTFHASKALQSERHSLAFLLKKYVNFDADKKFQVSDWRVRPLPQPMMDYARSDTHYLLYVYDVMRNELIQESQSNLALVQHVLDKSRDVALQRYVKHPYDTKYGRNPGGWAVLLDKWKVNVTFNQVEVFKHLHAWRDHLAREEDESPSYVLPNHMLYSLALNCPIDSAGVLGVAQHTPPSLRIFALDLANLIKSVVESNHALPSAHAPIVKFKSIKPAAKAKEEVIDPNSNQRTNLPVSDKLKSANQISDLPIVQPIPNLQLRSNLFGHSFFDNFIQLTKVNMAMVDQIHAGLDLSPFPKSLKIELEDAFTPVGKPTHKEDHIYQPQPKKPVTNVTVLSGKSQFGNKPHTLDQAMQPILDQEIIELGSSSDEEEDKEVKPKKAKSEVYTQSTQLVNEMLNQSTTQVTKKHKKNKTNKKQEGDEKNEVAEGPYDPFEIQEDYEPAKALDKKRVPGQAKGNKGQTFRKNQK